MNEYRYFIKKITKKEDDTVILELGDIRGIPVFDFQPGQYVMIYYKDENGHVLQKHTFSIASSPFENGTIRLGIRVAGPFTTGLMHMKEGDEIFVSGPYGNFTFKHDKHFDLVFIAGGVGITPFMSAIRYATSSGLPNKMTLLYSNRSLASTLFLDEILELEKNNKNFQSLFSITEEKLPYEMKGVVNARLDAKIIQNFIGDIYGKTFFICGPKNFMEAMKENLRNLGVYDFQIETEGFSMIADDGWRPKLRNTAYALGFAVAIFFLPFYFVSRSIKNFSFTKNASVVLPADSSAPIFPSVISTPSSDKSSFQSPTNSETPLTTSIAPTNTPAPSMTSAAASSPASVSTSAPKKATVSTPAPTPKTKTS